MEFSTFLPQLQVQALSFPIAPGTRQTLLTTPIGFKFLTPKLEHAGEKLSLEWDPSSSAPYFSGISVGHLSIVLGSERLFHIGLWLALPLPDEEALEHRGKGSASLWLKAAFSAKPQKTSFP